MTYTELKQKFQDKTVSEGWFLLTASDAIDMINYGLSQNMKLGIVEGFLRSSEGAFEPRQEYSSNQFMNLEDDEYKTKTIDLVKNSAEVPNLYFEVFMS